MTYPPQQGYPQQPGYPPQQGYPQQGYPQYAPQGGYQPQQVVSASFVKHTGMLLAWQQSTTRVQGSFEQVAAAYKSAQTHCLALGWWSISSIIFFNWFAIIKNAVEYGKAKKAAGR